MNVNLFTFFKGQQQRWRRENSRRSEDYIQGGATAIREVGDQLLARKDAVDTDKLATQLADSEKENRYVQKRNAELNQQVREVTAKYEQLQRDYEVQRLDLDEVQRKPAPAPTPPVRIAPAAAQNRKKAELLAENGALRQRIKNLEELLVADGRSTADPGSELASLRGQVKTLRAALDDYQGKARVGQHVFDPAKFLKRCAANLAEVHLPAEIRLLFMGRHVKTAQDILAGREPEEWVDKPDLSIYHQAT